MTKYNEAFFDAGVERKNTHCVKWDASKVGDEDLPMWVADWDFACPDPIVQAVRQRAEHPCYGYCADDPQDEITFCDYWQRHHGVSIKPEETYMMPCVVTGLKLAARVFANADEKIVLMPPVYGPFRKSVECNHRVPAVAPLVPDQAGRYSMDFDAIEAQLKDGARCVFLCNPHNPVSRAWSREELQHLLNLCLSYHAVLVSDEIHADFVYEPNRFVSALALDGNEQCVIAFAAASKTFNVPGLQQAMAVSHNPQLLSALREEGECAGVTSGNVFALAGTQAAYRDCDDWLEGLKNYLEESRTILTRAVPQLMPKAVLSPIEATCLCWLDLRAYAPTCEELQRRVKKHHLVLNDGTFFDKTLGEGFLRLNFACPHARLLEGLKRLAEAMNDPE
jgi:cysteine-S-conjugate beta-lyase